MAQPSADIAARLVGMQKAIGPEATKKRVQRLSTALVAAANNVPAGDLGGDKAFSGWKKIGPLRAKANPHSDGMGTTIGREPKSAGGWRVAQIGRNQGETGAFLGPAINRVTGATNRTKTGKIKKPSFKSGRKWNGVTKGFGTWDKVDARLAKVAPKQIGQETRADVIKAFRGG